MAERILVADDEEALVRAVTYALEREGYSVDAVSNGTDVSRRRVPATTIWRSSTS